MKLVPSNSPILRTVSKPVSTEKLWQTRGLYLPMFRLMLKLKGCGLAANQIGIAERFFVWNFGMVINPEIMSHGEEIKKAPEGCLSFPGQIVNKERFTEIKVKYVDEYGFEKVKELTGVSARVFQHENDHLNGICIV